MLTGIKGFFLFLPPVKSGSGVSSGIKWFQPLTIAVAEILKRFKMDDFN
jgi:hypothetical protein